MNTGKAKKLRVHVIRDGEKKVDLTFPIYTLNVIESVMPENILKNLKAQRLNIPSMIEKVKNSGFIPQTVFEQITDGKTFKVWVE